MTLTCQWRSHSASGVAKKSQGAKMAALFSDLGAQVAITSPPAARMTSPVIHADSSDAKNTAGDGAEVDDAPAIRAEPLHRLLHRENRPGTLML